MKTNKILMAVALPALLAACTAEEIVEQSPVANISGRALLDPNFSVSVAEGAESRFAWEGYNWKFEEGDQFGAAVTDVAEQGKVTGTSLIGNYIFSKNEADNWITDSQMSEGIYQYYSFDGFKTKQARELVAFDLTGQEAILSEADAELNKYENQLMITPLYTLEEEYSTKALPLEFYSYYGVGAIKFKNIAGQDLKITQIVFNADKMTVKGRVNPEAFENWAEYVYNEEAGKYVLEAVNNAMVKYNKSDKTAADKKAKEDAIKAAEKKFEEDIYTKTAAAEAKAEKGDKESTFITLDCNNYLLKEGKTVTAYMMLPAGAKNIHVEIMVVDEDGEAWSVYATADGIFPEGVDPESGYGDEMKAIKVKDLEDYVVLRHKTNAIFGKTTDGKGIKNIEITEDNLVENSGYYVDNKADLMALLDNDLGDIRIHNSGDLYIDEDIVEAINEYTGAGVSFSNPIEIKSTEELTDEEDLMLTDVEFAGLIVKGANEKEGFEGTVIELGEDVKVGELTVEEGATVTLVDGTYTNVENNGTLNVKNAADVDEIENNAVLNVQAEGIEITNNGNLTYSAVYNTNGSLNTAIDVEASDLTLNAGGNVTVGENVTLTIDKDFVVGKQIEEKTDGSGQYVGVYSTLTNNGEIKMSKNLTVKGALVNNGTVKGEGILTIDDTAYTPNYSNGVEYASGATVTNAELAEVDVTTIVIDAKSKVTTSGDFLGTAVTLNGEIIIADSSAHVNVTEGEDGQINNSKNGVIESLPAEGVLVYAVMGDMTDGKELDAYDSANQISKIKVNGRWTINAKRAAGVRSAEAALKDMGIKEIEFAAKKALYIKDGASLDLSGIDVKVGTVKEIYFEGYMTGKSILTMDEPEKLVYNTTYGYKTEWYANNLTIYESEESVQAKIAEGGDVTLMSDVVLSKPLSVTEDLNLDLNGNTMTIKLDDTMKPTDKALVYGMIQIDANNIEVTVGNGNMDATNKWSTAFTSASYCTDVLCFVFGENVTGSELTIEDGKYYTGKNSVGNGSQVIRSYAGKVNTINLNGGEFKTAAPVVANGYSIWMPLAGSAATWTVGNGAVFYNYNPAVALNVSGVCNLAKLTTSTQTVKADKFGEDDTNKGSIAAANLTIPFDNNWLNYHAYVKYTVVANN